MFGDVLVTGAGLLLLFVTTVPTTAAMNLRHNILAQRPHTAYLRNFLAHAAFLITLFLGGLLGQASLGAASIGVASSGGVSLRVLLGRIVLVGILLGRYHRHDSLGAASIGASSSVMLSLSGLPSCVLVGRVSASSPDLESVLS